MPTSQSVSQSVSPPVQLGQPHSKPTLNRLCTVVPQDSRLKTLLVSPVDIVKLHGIYAPRALG